MECPALFGRQVIPVGMQYVPFLSERARQVFETTGFFHSFQTTGKIVEYTLNLPGWMEYVERLTVRGQKWRL